MTYVVRKGNVNRPEGSPQFGIEAVVSRDHGETWDLDHKYSAPLDRSHQRGADRVVSEQPSDFDDSVAG